MKKLFVFDWNGTLLHDVEANLAGFNETLKMFGRPESTLENYRATMDFPLVHVYTRNHVPVDDYLAKFDEATDIFFGTYHPIAKTCKLQDGSIELLEYLTETGWDLMILSNQNDYDLRNQIAERHVTPYFKIISGNFDKGISGYTKTNKLERLKAILAENDYDLGESYIIGDSLEEPALAKDLGLKCISVTWGCFARDRLEKSPTNHVIDDLAEAIKILQKSEGLKEAV